MIQQQHEHQTLLRNVCSLFPSTNGSGDAASFASSTDTGEGASVPYARAHQPASKRGGTGAAVPHNQAQHQAQPRRQDEPLRRCITSNQTSRPIADAIRSALIKGRALNPCVCADRQSTNWYSFAGPALLLSLQTRPPKSNMQHKSLWVPNH